MADHVAWTALGAAGHLARGLERKVRKKVTGEAYTSVTWSLRKGIGVFWAIRAVGCRWTQHLRKCTKWRISDNE